MKSTKSEVRNLGARIRAFRVHVGLSQAALAKICKVSQANVSQWESGKISPTIKLLQLFRSLYPKVNIEWFFEASAVTGDPFNGGPRINKENKPSELMVTRNEVKRLSELVELQEKEIQRLRKQNEVLTIVARKRLL